MKITELEDSVDDAQTKANNAEKVKNRITMELEDTSVELDRVKNDLSSMDKKQRKVITDLTRKYWFLVG